MKTDWKYFCAAIAVIMILLTVGIMQLDPPADRQEHNLYYPANSWLMLDLLCEERMNGSAEAGDMLLKYLKKTTGTETEK